MSINPEALRLQEQLDDQLGRVLDQQTRDMVAAWIRAWDEVAPDLDTALSALMGEARDGVVPRALMVRNQRLQRALSQIAEQLVDLADQSGLRIVGDLHQVVADAAAAQRAIMAVQFPNDRDLPRGSVVDDRVLDAIVSRSAEQITSLTEPLADDAYDAVRRELVRGVAVGTNPLHTADRMLRRTETHFNGGLGRAVNIARTETIDAHRAGAQAGQDKLADVMAGWVWLAHLDVRMCPACLGMHGTVHPLSEPGPLGHQQCRCSRMPKSKSWADLGFDDVEDDDDVPDADAWFEDLTPAEQQRLLGRERYRAWVAGEFPREEWARRRENDGWRDSYVPAKPGEARPDADAAGTGGNGGEPPVPPAPPAPEPAPEPDGPDGRRLPYDVDAAPETEPGGLVGARPVAPPAVADLADRVAPPEDPYQHFSADEESVAEWLSERGVAVRSVAATTAGRSPDAVLDDLTATVELKTVSVPRESTIVRAVRSARYQSPRVVVDGRLAGVTIETAQAAIATIVRQYGQHLQELLILTAAGTAVAWTHGPED